MEERKVKFEEGELLAKEFNMKFFETSARDNINVNELFDSLTKDILNYNSLPTGHTIKIEKEDNSNSKKEIKKEKRTCCK